MRKRFLEDVVRMYISPVVKIDIEDLAVVFRGVRSPKLGVGTASGDNRARLAAQQAFREAGGVAAAHALIVIAFPPGDVQLADSKVARGTIREHLIPDTFMASGMIEDEQLTHGTMRVSVLLG